MRIVFWLILTVLLSSGCKPKQNAVSTPAMPSPSSETGDEIQAKQDALNNLVISFYSVGSGANLKAAETIENFLIEYSSKIERRIPYSKIAWGREGEVDFCISLTELTGEDKGIFVGKIRELVKQFELIHFFENHPCRELK